MERVKWAAWVAITRTRETEGESTPLACGFGRPAQTFVPQSALRAAGEGWWNEVFGGPPKTARQRRALPGASGCARALAACLGLALALTALQADAAPPAIELGPANQNVVQGGSFTMNATVSGTAPLTFQWFKNGVAISGATGPSLSITNAPGNPGANHIGPSTTVLPFMETLSPGFAVQALFAAGDTVNNKPDGVTPYRFAGIPDGLGAFDNGDGTFTVLVNHEISAQSGLPRRHGVDGAFVTRLVLSKSTLAVLHASDLVTNVFLWDVAQQKHLSLTSVGFNRFCSADLPVPTALFNAATGRGTTNKLFLTGEEVSADGRAFAHVVTGPAAGSGYELAHLGKYAHENVVANPFAQDKTIVASTDDPGAGGQVYVYVGTKTATGSDVERAGLVGGNLYGVVVSGLPAEANNTTAAPRAFSLFNLGDASGKTGAELETLSQNNNVTVFKRPEDGAWDPRNPRDFYFVTSASFDEPSRLWRLRFADVTNPTAGGVIEMLLDGNGGHHMLDNLTFDQDGNLLLQEDPGDNALSARIWKYDLSNNNLLEVAQHKPALVTPGAPGFLTQDEESSGIIDVSAILGYRAYLVTVQLHGSARLLPGTREELVDDGQLLLLRETAAGDYYLRVANAEGAAVSGNAAVAVAVPPVIDARLQTQPLVHQVVSPGRSASFTFDTEGVIGTGPFTFQWLRDNTVIPNATGTTLTVNGVNDALAGSYRMRVTGGGGSTVSAPAGLTTLRLANYSGFVGLVLAGPPNARFLLQKAPNLNAPIEWSDMMTVTLSGPGLVSIGGSITGAPLSIYRAVPVE